MKCESIIVKLSDVKCVLTQNENNFGIALYTLWHLCWIVDCDCAEYVRATLQMWLMIMPSDVAFTDLGCVIMWIH